MTVVTDTPADLKKIRSMNFAQLGRGAGGVPAGRRRAARAGRLHPPLDEGDAKKKSWASFPANGFAIP